LLDWNRLFLDNLNHCWLLHFWPVEKWPRIIQILN
jgi:hypothetical protein